MNPSTTPQLPGTDCSNGCSPCECGKCTYSTCDPNQPDAEASKSTIACTGTGTVAVRTNLDPNGFSGYTTHSGCLKLPLKSGGVLNIAYTQLAGSGMPVMYSGATYWQPAGRSGVFGFLSFMNNFYVEYTGDGTITWNEDPGNDNQFHSGPALNIYGFFIPSTKEFMKYNALISTYYVYLDRRADNATKKPLKGRLLRVMDRNANTLYYNYDSTKGLLRSITGDIPGVIPYFGYDNDTLPTNSNPAPITRIQLFDTNNPAASRNVYFEYQSTTTQDCFLQKITNPDGCVTEYKMVNSNANANDLVAAIQREVDAEGYTTYYFYIEPNKSTVLSASTEPEDRTTYFLYESFTTRKQLQGREATYYKYLLSGNEFTPDITQELDPIGRVTYYAYTAADRISQKVAPRWAETGDLQSFTTYYGYNDFYGIAQENRAFDNATTYYGYDTDQLETVRMVGPRDGENGLSVVTYYEYDALRNRTVTIDPLGDRMETGRDSIGRVVKMTDLRGNPTYYAFNVNTGYQTAMMDAAGDVAYYGYNGFGNRTVEVSPRGEETGLLAQFAAYYGYDDLNRRVAMLDAAGNASYYSYTPRSDLGAMMDPREMTTYYTYNGLRLMTQQVLAGPGASGVQLVTQHGYDIYKNRIKTLDPRGNAAYFGYDAIDRLVVTLDAVGNTRYFGYDANSNRVTSLDPRGYAIYFGYDPANREVKNVNVLSNTVYFGYDKADNQVARMDARNNATYFGFDALNRRVTSLDAAVNTVYFGYDANSNQVKMLDSRSNATYFGFDAINRMVTMLDAASNAAYFGYDANSNQVRMLDSRSNVAYFGFDSIDRRVTSLDAVGNAAYFGYDGNSNQVKMLDPRSNAAYFGFDAINRRVTSLDALGNTVYFGYNANSNQIKMLDALNHATYFGFDAINRRVTLLDAVGNTAYFGYDGNSNMVKSLDARSNAAYFGFDAINRRVTSLDAVGNTAYFGYDGNSNQVKVLDPRSSAVYFGFDAINRVVQAIDAVNGTAYFGYDRNSNHMVFLDQLSHATYFGYDAINRGIVTLTADGSTSYFAFDRNSNRVIEMDPLSHSTYYTFDAINRVTAMLDPLQLACYYAYDRNSNMTRRLGQAQNFAYYAYDAIDRLTTKAYTDSVLCYYGYDRNSNVVAISDTWGAHYFGYDAINRPLVHKLPVTGIGINTDKAVYFSYDSSSNRTKILYPEPQDAFGSLTAYYGYDVINRLSKVLAISGLPAYYAYDAASNCTQKLLGNGVAGDMVYDAANRVTAIRWHDGAAAITYFEFNRDPKGMITRAQRPVENFTTYYTYDVNDRLLAEKRDDASAFFYYAYDLASNRTKQYSSLDGAATYFAYAADNSLTASWRNTPGNETYYLYDANGSITNIYGPAGATYFAYTAANQIQRMYINGGVTTYFEYDANLQRYAIYDNNCFPPKYYIWDGLNLLEIRDTNFGPLWRFTNGTTVIPGIGTCVEAMQYTSTKYYLLTDHRGSVVKILDANKMVIASCEYNAFGELISTTGTWPLYLPYRYQTNWFTLKTLPDGLRLDLSHAGVYHSGAGRFLYRDPIGSSRDRWGVGGLNLYTAFDNDPVNRMDPRGLFTPIIGPDGKPLPIVVKPSKEELEKIRKQEEQRIEEKLRKAGYGTEADKYRETGDLSREAQIVALGADPQTAQDIKGSKGIVVTLITDNSPDTDPYWWNKELGVSVDKVITNIKGPKSAAEALEALDRPIDVLYLRGHGAAGGVATAKTENGVNLDAATLMNMPEIAKRITKRLTPNAEVRICGCTEDKDWIQILANTLQRTVCACTGAVYAPCECRGAEWFCKKPIPEPKN